jgi:phosphatidylserine decarboxylase
MHIYKKAYPLLLVVGIILLTINGLLLMLHFKIGVQLLIVSVSIVFYIFIIAFFRVPERTVSINDNLIYSPADGKVVAIEEVFENEFLKRSCIKISIFMSVFNVHQNYIPVSGKVIFSMHHPGKYLVAWHPKSSSKNEHTSVVIETFDRQQILIRQIAGIVARRIICNIKEGDVVKQGDELGFILFGSRVDVFMPMGLNVTIKPGEKVKANKSIIAKF